MDPNLFYLDWERLAEVTINGKERTRSTPWNVRVQNTEGYSKTVGILSIEVCNIIQEAMLCVPY